ncbi:Hypothetical protein NTJ_05492 [Nesidiocoris tenuis]|uniref:Uncharacterized protein n=1 Tax=Nesidiocoris tenuis TaxID=355587 RepID=A0ABN7AKA1_9HEMI|nr:Hypothetical protein NTJ_05492 [Nesidiocoris tenuis]
MRSFHTRKRCGKFTVIRIAENNMRLRERNRRYPRGAPVLFPRGQRKDGAEEVEPYLRRSGAIRAPRTRRASITKSGTGMGK